MEQTKWDDPYKDENFLALGAAMPCAKPFQKDERLQGSVQRVLTHFEVADLVAHRNSTPATVASLAANRLVGRAHGVEYGGETYQVLLEREVVRVLAGSIFIEDFKRVRESLGAERVAEIVKGCYQVMMDAGGRGPIAAVKVQLRPSTWCLTRDVSAQEAIMRTLGFVEAMRLQEEAIRRDGVAFVALCKLIFG